MARTRRDNKDVFQSYVFTMAKYDFTIYEKRIMYRLVELAQSEIEGYKMADHMYQIEPKTLGGRIIQMPVSAILRNETDKNYEIAKKAFKSLARKGVEYEDDKIWTFVNIITNPRIKKGEGVARFEVCDEIWKCILNFTHGYKKYELVTAMSFKSVYSMRFYELLSGQKEPLSFCVEDLRNRFGLKSKYKRADDFKKNVLDVAKKELDENSPYSFTYDELTIPSRGRNGYKVTGYTFYPRFIHKNRDMKLEEKELNAKMGNITGRFGMLDKNVSDYLLYNLDIPKESINTNKTTFLQAQRLIPNLVDVLAEIAPKLRDKDKPIGYLIATLKGKMKDLYTEA